ncbi:MAG: nickel-dependent hydrogenase large subunit [Rhodospirillales bacterium]|nr:nickel-dependent hydrogenase large subunit [Rhodospirillales bacterium]
MSRAEARTIRVDALARVEGEGALSARIVGGKVTELAFRIYEPPRFFEALLRGRMFTEAPDITSRICGICPVAYILSASQAMEAACGVQVDGPLRDLRRLIYCGEWIESHVLHAAMLHAPDFLGLPDAIAIARIRPELVTTALALKKLGNSLIEAIGGRAIHPVNLRVGGFYRAPATAKIRALADPLHRGLDQAIGLARAFAAFDFPELDVGYTFVSLRHNREYAIHEGRIVSSLGLDARVETYLEHFHEEQSAHSTALWAAAADGSAYLLGPLARYANSHDQLTPIAREIAAEIGLGPVCRNPYRSILVRMVEVVLACEEAIRLAEAYEEPAVSAAPVHPAAAVGHGATEAPRGLCYHRYRIDGDGRIVEATIMPPTSQNQRQIEADLRLAIEAGLDLDDDGLRARCEQTIRNHDPCISCATHALKVTIARE